MTVTKENLIDSIYRLVEGQKKATQTIETLLDMLKDSLADGDDILLSGFGKFCVKNKHERRGRNPSTGEDLILDPRRVVRFKPSNILIQNVNNSEG
jgi:integration host factor subunit alpha